MSYPSTLDNFTPKSDGVDDVMAQDINELQGAIEAVEAELGTDPAGSAASLKARLAHSLNDAGFLALETSTVLTISNGAVTATQTYHRIDTEASAATDNLDTINGSANGMILILRPTNAARVPTIRHAAGNILCAGGANITLSDVQELAVLLYDATLSKWIAFKGVRSDQLAADSAVAGGVPYYTSAVTVGYSDALLFDAVTKALTLYGPLTVEPMFTTGDESTNHTVASLGPYSDVAVNAGFGGDLILFGNGTAYPLGRLSWIFKTAPNSPIGELRLYVQGGATEYQAMRVVADTEGTIFNDAAADRDFRVETITYNAINIDASNNSVLIMDNASGKVGFFGKTPAARQAALTTQLTTITYTEPGTPDYAIQNLTNSGGYGFVTSDEAQSLLKVVANLQTRVAQLETRLSTYGLLP